MDDDHLLKILDSLGVDFNDYFNWLFDELNILLGTEIGFVFQAIGTGK
jgi:hypothetical protein